jgi:hypothetical protein
VSKGSWKHSAETKRKIGAKTSERYRRARLEAIVEPDHKRCSKCKVVKPIREFHVRRYKIKDGHREGPEARCKGCKYEDYKRWKTRKREEGVDLYALWLRYNRKGKTKAGKALTAARARERRATKRREEGVSIAGPRKKQVLHEGQRLDVDPLLQLLKVELPALARERNSANGQGEGPHRSDGSGALAELSGVSTRRLYALLHGEQQLVALSTVDKILVGLGLPHMLPILYPEA